MAEVENCKGNGKAAGKGTRKKKRSSGELIKRAEQREAWMAAKGYGDDRGGKVKTPDETLEVAEAAEGEGKAAGKGKRKKNRSSGEVRKRAEQRAAWMAAKGYGDGRETTVPTPAKPKQAPMQKAAKRKGTPWPTEMPWPTAAADLWNMGPETMAMMWEMMSGKGSGKGSGKVQKQKEKQNQSQNQKRSRNPDEPMHPKQTLAVYLGLMLGRDVTSADYQYEFAEIGKNQWTATLQLPNVEGDQVFQGPEALNKKIAETEVARVAVSELEDTVQPLLEARSAEKKEKEEARKAEKRAKLA